MIIFKIRSHTNHKISFLSITDNILEMKRGKKGMKRIKKGMDGKKFQGLKKDKIYTYPHLENMLKPLVVS